MRELEPGDQDFLWEMLYVALWDAPGMPRRPRSILKDPRIMRLVENWGRPDDFGLVTVDRNSGEHAGAIWSRLDRFDGLEDYGCSYPCLGIAVAEPYQGSGVGTLLMSRFIEDLRDRVSGLRLGVNPENSRALRLYEKSGFVQYAVGAGDYPQMKLTFRQS